ncbi:MAG: hypothetical protein J6V69_05170 [Clostridia bacterium]|nr:hypothetical protein [Clostridia bacterium]
MKKFLIGVIFLIPIVVVIALSATGAIISLTTPVNPMDMVIKDSDNVEIERGVPIKVDSKNFDEFIIIDVLPAITQDKDVTYEIVEEAGEGRVELERMGESNRYSIIPIKIGVCKLEIRAKANVNVFKEITIYVTSDSIETIEIYDANGEFVGEHVDAVVGGRYFVDINPIDALRNNDVQWSSTNTAVAEISANGEIKIVGKGVTIITASAVDKDGNTVKDFFDLNTENAIVSSSTLYCSENEITTDYLKATYALSDEVVVSAVEGNVYSFTLGANVVNVEVFSVGESEVGFIGLSSVMYTRNGGYFPIVGVLASGEIVEGAEYSVSNVEVLELEPKTGMIIPLKAGSSMIRATYNGVIIEKEVIVKENPIAFELELGTADQKLGIQLTRTWGRYWLDENGNRTNVFRFGLDDKSNAFDVEWSVNEEGLVNITRVENSQDVNIEFLEESKGKSVTLTAVLKVNNLLQQRVKRSFTFNLRERDAVNVYDWEEFKRVVDINHNDIVMQADLYPTDTSGLRSDLYGNGFKIDGTNFPVIDEGHFRNWIIDADKYGDGHWEFIETGKGKIVIEDVVAIGSTLYEESTSVLGFINFYWCYCPIEVKYCQLSGFNEGLSFRNALHVLVEGCIFGENDNNGVSIQHEPGRAEDASFTFRNNIFKQQGGAAIQIVTSWFHENAMDKPFKVDFNFEGFMDVYNWKQREEFKGVFAQALLSLVGTDIISGSLRDIFAETVAKVVDSFIKKPEYDGLFYKYGGEEYASFAFVALGLIAEVDTDRIYFNTNSPMSNFGIPLEDENGVPKGQLASIVDLMNLVVKPSKPLHVTNPCILSCTDFVNYEPEIKPGDPVPNSKELYAKLVGAIEN